MRGPHVQKFIIIIFFHFLTIITSSSLTITSGYNSFISDTSSTRILLCAIAETNEAGRLPVKDMSSLDTNSSRPKTHVVTPLTRAIDVISFPLHTPNTCQIWVSPPHFTITGATGTVKCFKDTSFDNKYGNRRQLIMYAFLEKFDDTTHSILMHVMRDPLSYPLTKRVVEKCDNDVIAGSILNINIFIEFIVSNKLNVITLSPCMVSLARYKLTFIVLLFQFDIAMHTTSTYFGSFEAGSRTPMQDTLGQFLNFTAQVPITPSSMINENSTAAVDIYSDNNYNILMSNADMIVNNGYNVNTQDIDIGFLNNITIDDNKKKRRSKGIGAAVKNLNIKKRKIISSSESSSSSSENSDDDDDKKNDNKTQVPVFVEKKEEGIRTIIKTKPRGRYVKKMCVSSVLKPVHIEKQSDVDPATKKLFNNIISSNSNNDLVVDNNRMFTNHMLDKSFYMFLVTKSVNPDQAYSIRFVNCVYSVHNEYTSHHMHHDRFILVVTYERFRFLISYNLLLSMNVDIPIQDRFDEKKLNNASDNMCYFEEVKDFEFLSLLTNLFQLDKVYIQGKFSLLLASIGEKKAVTLFNQISEMVSNKSVFTIPFYITKKEANPEELVKKYDRSLYVEDIMNLSKGLKFKQLMFNQDKPREQIVEEAVNSLAKFYTNKPVRGDKDKNNSFTYKYGCVTRQFYDVNDKNATKLYKIKKENGSIKLIENYLEACKELFDSHNFMLVSTKADERITVVKMGMEFLWITSVLKDIVIEDIVKKFGMYDHHIFNLNNGNRKEVNNRHNGMIKLLSLYTGKLLNFKELIHIATTKFLCNFNSILFNKNK
ncbi:ie1 [Alphabaculovirus alterspexiguae]|uniref:Ie1 n=1 Tax=Spodoptera exigua multiple nucleopolyhedrovirus TaxID=10454 RepID=A0A3G2JU56_9ABAC|nr:ie1 [Spodoptera exigua multiple nucleopolyhedrovirus]AYN45080.1 ie1 [Spodoptera exigua multiple nucleopolyhedrovirus]